MRSASAVCTTRIDLSAASVLVVERTKTSMTILVQILEGFGVKNIHRCLSIESAREVIESRQVDLIVMDPTVEDDKGYQFVHWLRRCKIEPNWHTPTILVTGHTQQRNVRRGMESGASYVVVKPITPAVLLDRILWIARENRPFVETPEYVGPDRRFRDLGPPAGLAGRRADDAVLSREQAS